MTIWSSSTQTLSLQLNLWPVWPVWANQTLQIVDGSSSLPTWISKKNLTHKHCEKNGREQRQLFDIDVHSLRALTSIDNSPLRERIWFGPPLNLCLSFDLNRDYVLAWVSNITLACWNNTCTSFQTALLKDNIVLLYKSWCIYLVLVLYLVLVF